MEFPIGLWGTSYNSQEDENNVLVATKSIEGTVNSQQDEEEQAFYESIRDVAAMEAQTGKNERGRMLQRRALLLTSQQDARTKRTKVGMDSFKCYGAFSFAKVLFPDHQAK